MKQGAGISEWRLADIFLELQEQGAANINLVTPTHYTPQIIFAIKDAKKRGLCIPIVYNCSGYEKVETLQMLEGIVDIYLTDFKYMDADLAAKYSKAPDYPLVAKKALEEMVRQCPEAKFDEHFMMKKGVIVRHLLLPGQLKNAKNIVKYLYKTYRDEIYMSPMNEYTPLPQVKDYPELCRKVTEEEYEALVEYAMEVGVEHGFIQEGETAEESFIPAFDCEGWKAKC
jgi:putative pyruvate formate lyase activating enzyme